MADNQFLAEALHLAEHGIPVFPCVVGGKEPLPGSKGHLDATTDPAKIRAMWRDQPFNIGISPDAAGLLIVDIDMKPGKDGEASWREYCRVNQITEPRTLQVTTPNGGRHIWYQGRGATTTGKIGKGIDTRGQGGYCLVPPSMIAGKPYVWANQQDIAEVPQAILKSLAKPEPKEQSAKVGEPVDKKTLLAVLDTIADIAKARERNPWRDVIAAIHATNCGTEDERLEIAKQWSAKWEGWDAGAEAELEKIWATMTPRDGGVAYGTLYKLATDRGFNKPPAALPSASEMVRGIVEAEMIPTDRGGAATDPWLKLFAGHDPADDENMPEVVFWDDDKTIPKTADGSIIVPYGPTGEHKTTVVMADCIDAVIKRGAKVVYAAGEGAHGVGKNRLPALCKARGKTTADLRGKWRTVHGIPDLSDGIQVGAFIAAHLANPPDFVVLDTLSAAKGTTKESNELGALVAANGPVGRIRRELRCVVFLIHHTGKDEDRGARGDSGLIGNADGAWLITTDFNTRKAKKVVEKMRDGEDKFAVEYKLTPPGQVPVATKIGRVDPTKAVQQPQGEGRALRDKVIEACRLLHATPEDENKAHHPTIVRMAEILAGDWRTYKGGYGGDLYQQTKREWAMKLRAGCQERKGRRTPLAALFYWHYLDDAGKKEIRFAVPPAPEPSEVAAPAEDEQVQHLALAHEYATRL